MKKTILQNGFKLTLREAKVEDAADMVLYMKLVVSETKNLAMGSGDFNFSVEEEVNFIKNNIDSKNSICIIGLIDNKIVSISNLSGGFYPRMRHRCDLGISILKKYWNMGIGTEMTKYVTEWAKNSKIIKKINLEVKENNENAIKLYKKMGFIEEGRISRGLFIENEFFDTLIMGLLIN